MLDTHHQTSYPGPTLEFRIPPSSLFQFPPNPRPATLPAPLEERSWTQPFQIPPTLYHQLLDVRVPITIASVYAVTVMIVNRINKRRGYKPWGISQTPLFKFLVILHNVFLAVYSAWTFLGMFQAFRNSMPSWSDKQNGGVVGVADALCKINGPRGVGNGAVYDTTTDRWFLPNDQYTLAAGGVPDSTDVGRLWNQGLAYFGWIFYLSKFYEVLDTAIILAKGKKSSTLQTYHHAGAMMCMWAGIRYMGQPIWIFALVNSFIHALMYTYYTLTALSVRIPNRVKRTLTTMQIAQFVFGSALAAVHLFVRYTVPVHSTAAFLTNAIPAVASAAESGVASAAVTGDLVPWLKKLAFRAAGAEGIAENVLNAQGEHFGADAARVDRFLQQGFAAADSSHVQYQMVDCVDTSGQAFAIWLNVFYLLPLTVLFGRFFVRSYLKKMDPRSSKHPAQLAERAGLDALSRVGREIKKAAMEMHGDATESPSSGTSSGTEDDAAKAGKKNNNNNDNAKISAEHTVEVSGRTNTRSTSVNLGKEKTTTVDEQGFSSVPAKHRAKKRDAVNPSHPESPTAPITVDEKENPFVVLNEES